MPGILSTLRVAFHWKILAEVQEPSRTSATRAAVLLCNTVYLVLDAGFFAVPFLAGVFLVAFLAFGAVVSVFAIASRHQ